MLALCAGRSLATVALPRTGHRPKTNKGMKLKMVLVPRNVNRAVTIRTDEKQ